ncbi:MAG: hypothetical protein GEV06_16745 [Luteitalea sp.]|nr:hypothetical protein [Luteitalea sp.]
MHLTDMTYDQANHMLRTGRASETAAREYVATWNAYKVSTQATLIEVRDNGFRHVEIIVVDAP